MDFRTASRRVPRALFSTGECRIFLGEPSTARERTALAKVRATLQALARRGDWDVLRRVKDGDLSPQEVHQAVQRVGWEAYHQRLARPAAAKTLRSAVDEWAETLRGRTALRYKQAAERLLAIVGEGRLMDHTFTRGDIQEALERLRRRGLAQNTRAADQTAWSALFTWWMEREEDRHEKTGRPPLIVKHPVRSLKRRHKVSPVATRNTFLAEEQFAEILRVTTAELRAQYATLLFCGLRPDELFHLRPEDIVLPTHIRIQARDDWKPKGYERWGVGEGSIPIHRKRLLPLLEKHAEEWAGERWFFVNPVTGDRWTWVPFAARMKKDCVAAGVPYGRKQSDGVTPHVFRHTLASWLARRDVQLKKIAELLRDTVGTVDKHYAHLLPRDLDATLNTVL